jgi:hypothetical protein
MDEKLELRHILSPHNRLLGPDSRQLGGGVHKACRSHRDA